jgi:Ulp1 family protease
VIAKILRQKLLNFECHRYNSGSSSSNLFTREEKALFPLCTVPEPFIDQEMVLSLPKIPYQDNAVDCGVFTWRYAYGIFIMRDLTFSFYDLAEDFKTMITKGSTFQFGLADIPRIRKEMEQLCISLMSLYQEYKDDQQRKEGADNSAPDSATSSNAPQNNDIVSSHTAGSVASIPNSESSSIQSPTNDIVITTSPNPRPNKGLP